MKIVLVHEYLTQLGGGEKVLQTLCGMFPEAPIYTLIYDEKVTGSAFKGRQIHTSFLQKLHGSKKFFRNFIPLMPLAVEQFDLSEYDLVISVSHSYAKGIITKPGTKHVCYCLTPTRYLWHNPGLPFKLVSRPLLTYLRNWDYQAAQRPDYFIADSENVSQRIKKYYNRDSEVIYPPVETNRFKISNAPKDYFLLAGRPVPYKRFDLAIEAFSRLPEERLVVTGDWPLYSKLRLKKAKGNNIKFIGRVSDKELPDYYANCKALIFPQEEDFGITPVEAMAAGRPVIAYRAGGALETVMEGEAGVFFDKQNPDSLIQAIKSFNNKRFNPEKIKRHSEKFSQKIFKDKLTEFLDNLT